MVKKLALLVLILMLAVLTLSGCAQPEYQGDGGLTTSENLGILAPM